MENVVKYLIIIGIVFYAGHLGKWLYEDHRRIYWIVFCGAMVITAALWTVRIFL